MQDSALGKDKVFVKLWSLCSGWFYAKNKVWLGLQDSLQKDVQVTLVVLAQGGRWLFSSGKLQIGFWRYSVHYSTRDPVIRVEMLQFMVIEMGYEARAAAALVEY